MNSYRFGNGVEIFKFKAKDLEINVVPLCLGNVSKDFSANNMKKVCYMDMSMIFSLLW